MTADLGSKLVETFKSYEGVPYVWGGSTPKGWDCSGACSYVLRQCGVKLPGGLKRDVSDQFLAYKHTKNPVPGDLVVWPAGHVGMYLGPNQMISALSPQYGTAATPIKGYGPGNAWVYVTVPGVSGSGATATDTSITGSIAGDAGGAILGSLVSGTGATSLKDLLERGALIIFGGLLILVAIWKLGGVNPGKVKNQVSGQEKNEHAQQKSAVVKAADDAD